MILPGTGRGTAPKGRGGGGLAAGETRPHNAATEHSLRKPTVYAARKLRRAMTLPEAMLWQRLRGNRIGVKVRRQHPVGPYVVDFYIREGKFVIEVDGEAHNLGDQPLRDRARDQYLSLNGYSVVRMPAGEILKNVDAVTDAIAARVASPLHQPSPSASAGPPPRAGEEL